MADTQHLTVPEVATRWRCSIFTIREYIKAGDLEAIRRGGRYLVTQHAVDEYEQAHSNTGPVRGRRVS